MSRFYNLPQFKTGVLLQFQFSTDRALKTRVSTCAVTSVTVTETGGGLSSNMQQSKPVGCFQCLSFSNVFSHESAQQGFGRTLLI